MKNLLLSFSFLFVLFALNAKSQAANPDSQNFDDIVLKLQKDDATLEYRFSEYKDFVSFVNENFGDYKQEDWFVSIEAKHCITSTSDRNCVSARVNGASSNIDDLIEQVGSALNKLVAPQ